MKLTIGILWLALEAHAAAPCQAWVLTSADRATRATFGAKELTVTSGKRRLHAQVQEQGGRFEAVLDGARPQKLTLANGELRDETAQIGSAGHDEINIDATSFELTVAPAEGRTFTVTVKLGGKLLFSGAAASLSPACGARPPEAADRAEADVRARVALLLGVLGVAGWPL